MQLWNRFTNLLVQGRLTLGPGATLVSGSSAVDLTARTGANVALTGYAIGSAGDVAATDSINAAIGKLEARIAALEAA